MPDSIHLSLSVLEKLVPFFLEWDHQGTLVRISRPLAQVWGENDLSTLSSELLLSRPFDADFKPSWLPELTDLTVNLQLKSKIETVLKGQVIQKDQGWIFAGFPVMHSISDLDSFGLKLSDLPLHDGVGDLLIATETSRASLMESLQSAAQLEASNAELQAVNKSFSRFVPTAFLDTLGHSSAAKVSLGDHVGIDKYVMFADLRGFTKISESMKSREIFQLINQYLSAVSPCIRDESGFVCQYLGDGLMALFPEAPESSIRAAISMQTALKKLQAKINIQGLRLQMGIGIHFGHLELGIIGEAYRWDSSVISDAVNIASRVEGLTKEFGAEVLVTQSVIDTQPQDSGLEYRRLGKVSVKGRTEKVTLYEILDSLDEDELASKISNRVRFEQALSFYEDGQITQAKDKFEILRSEQPTDKATTYYLDQISQIQ